jgi:hypothetical protein
VRVRLPLVVCRASCPRVVFASVCALAFAVVLRPGPAAAQVETYPVAERSSELRLGGMVAGFSMLPQRPGSLLTSYGGHINAEADQDSIRIPGGGVIDALLDERLFEPGEGGGEGGAPADYGMTLIVPLGSGMAAIRGLAFDISGPEAPLLEGWPSYYSFPVDSLTLIITAGTLDYSFRSLRTLSGSHSLVGLSSTLTGGGSFVPIAGAEPLTITFEAYLPFTLVEPNDSRLDFSGSISTDFIPDPSTIAPVTAGGLLLIRRRRGRTRS